MWGRPCVNCKSAVCLLSVCVCVCVCSGMDACHVFPHGILDLVPLIRGVFATVITAA